MPTLSTFITGCNKRCLYLASATLCVISIISADVIAHGGVSIEDDLCIMRIGTMRAHFTGYQPKLRASQEFCEDIPELGEAIIVLDFLSRGLRKMDISFQIVRGEAGTDANTTFADIESILDNPDSILIEEKTKRYPSGSFNVSLMIQQPGWYVGVLTAHDPESNEKYISVFPFSVAQKDFTGLILWFLAIVILGISFYFLSARGSRQERKNNG